MCTTRWSILLSQFYHRCDSATQLSQFVSVTPLMGGRVCFKQGTVEPDLRCHSSGATDLVTETGSHVALLHNGQRFELLLVMRQDFLGFFQYNMLVGGESQGFYPCAPPLGIGDKYMPTRQIFLWVLWPEPRSSC